MAAGRICCWNGDKSNKKFLLFLVFLCLTGKQANPFAGKALFKWNNLLSTKVCGSMKELYTDLAVVGGSTPASTGDSGSGSTEPVNIVRAGWSGEEEASKEIFQRMRTTYEEASGNTVT